MNCSDFEAITPLYLSGELDSERTNACAAHLKRCGSCAHEIERQFAIDARLRASVLREPVDSSLLERRIQAATAFPLRQWIWASAAVAAAVVLAAVLLYWQHTPRLYVDAAEDHRDEIVYKQPRKWLTNPVAINALAQSQQVPPAALQALNRAGFRLQGAKLCRLEGRRYVHLVYTDGTQEFSVFLHQGPTEPNAKNRPVDATKTSGESIACFETSTFTAIFVADGSRQTVLDLARSTAAVL